MGATDLGMKLVTLSLVEEALRYLTYKFLTFSDPTHSAVPIFALNNERRSPLIAATQYLTGLLFGDSARLVLLYQRAGFTSLAEWEENRPQHIRYVRRLVMLACAWVQRRHVDRLQEFPFLLAMLADPDYPLEKKETAELYYRF